MPRGNCYHSFNLFFMALPYREIQISTWPPGPHQYTRGYLEIRAPLQSFY